MSRHSDFTFTTFPESPGKVTQGVTSELSGNCGYSPAPLSRSSELTVAWEEAGEAVEQRLGRMDLILNPPGRTRSFRNDGVADVVFMLVSGNAPGQDVRFEPA